ncbi:MAG: NYN domain-containing protein [bacterium]|nr:NYN domain-containing protein [bacterium]
MKKLVIGILAHVDAGKTTLSESLLYEAGQIRRLGRVDHRDTYLDTHALERERGITIFSKQAQLRWEDMEITLLDTPGHVDFSSEMERALQVLDYAILVISGTDGVQSHTETLWELLRRYRVPTFLFITKMDVASRSSGELMTELQQRLAEGCVDFTHGDEAQRQESVAMLSEEALERYAATGGVDEEMMASLISARLLFPCVFGSGLKMDGVGDFLRLLSRLTREKKAPDAFAARVYKIARDAQGNRLTYMKITGGTLRVRDTLRYAPLHGSEALEEKVSQLRIYSGEKYESVEKAESGRICAVLGLSATWPGQGLGVEADADAPLLESVLGYRVVLPDGVDAAAALPRLRQLEEEDPQLHLVWQEETGEIRLQLMGAVQLDVLRSLIRERFDLDVRFDAGRILYRETIADTVEGVGHYEPLRHYAEVHLLLEPGERGSGVVLANACSEDTLALNWQRLILTHLEERQHKGVLTGSPLTDVRITLLTGRAHLKHTEGGDFRQATYRAVRQGLMQARSVLLEPYYDFRLELPAEQIGRALSDVRAMGGEHGAPVSLGERMVLTGKCSVAAMQGYAAEVAAYSRGKGRFSCRPGGYRPCKNPGAVIAEIGYDAESDLPHSPDSVFCAHGAGFTVKWDQVKDYMHLDDVWKPPAEEAPPPPRAPRRSTDIDERELEAIMEREFGPIRRSVYSAPTVRTAPAAPAAGKRERLLIDGYNVIFAWDDLKALAAESLDLARSRLIEMLVNYQAYTQREVALIFDAYRVSGGRGEREDQGGLHIAYTRAGESADMYIEQLAHDIGRNESVRVVTSDSLIRLSALRAGVLRTSSREFRGELDAVLAEIRRKTEGSGK